MTSSTFKERYKIYNSGADPDRGERGLSHGQIFPLKNIPVDLFSYLLNLSHTKNI